jgi:hypothetical protein
MVKTAYEPTAGDVLGKYREGASQGGGPRSGGGSHRARQVWSIAFELPRNLPRRHVTHTTASDLTAAKRDVLRHLPEGTRVLTAEPTRSVRRRAHTKSTKKRGKPRLKRAKGPKRMPEAAT